MVSIPSASMSTVHTDPTLDVIELDPSTDSGRGGNLRKVTLVSPSGATPSSYSSMAPNVPGFRVAASVLSSESSAQHNQYISEFAKAKGLWDPFYCQKVGVRIIVLTFPILLVSVVVTNTALNLGPMWLASIASPVILISALFAIFAIGLFFFGLRREVNIGTLLIRKANGEIVDESEAFRNTFRELYNQAMGIFVCGYRTRSSIERDPDDPNRTPERQPEGHWERHQRQREERSARFFGIAKWFEGYSFRKSGSEDTCSLGESRKP